MQAAATAMADELYFHTYICALCENRTSLESKCCCQNSEDGLHEVTDERLLKRSNLRRGDKVCAVHLNKLKSGLIFGGSANCCSAPFHVGSSSGQRLRPVPRAWRQYFDVSEVTPRYMPSLQICNTCYKITLDLLFDDKSTEIEDDNSIDSSVSSPKSVYLSPRRWLSTQSLQNAESSEGTAFSWSSSHSQHRRRPQANLLSLYAAHREKYGHPTVVPESIQRYFTSKAKHERSGNKESLNGETSVDEDDTSVDLKVNIHNSQGSSNSKLFKRTSSKVLFLTSSPQQDTADRLCYKIHDRADSEVTTAKIQIDGKSLVDYTPRKVKILRKPEGDEVEVSATEDQEGSDHRFSDCIPIQRIHRANNNNANMVGFVDESKSNIARKPDIQLSASKPTPRKRLKVSFQSVKTPPMEDSGSTVAVEITTAEKTCQTQVASCDNSETFSCIRKSLHRYKLGWCFDAAVLHEMETISSEPLEIRDEIGVRQELKACSDENKITFHDSYSKRLSKSLAKEVVSFVMNCFNQRGNRSKFDNKSRDAEDFSKSSLGMFGNSLAQNMVDFSIKEGRAYGLDNCGEQSEPYHKACDASLGHFSSFGLTLADVMAKDVLETIRQLNACHRCSSNIVRRCLQIVSFAQEEAERIMSTAIGMLQTAGPDEQINKTADIIVAKAMSSALLTLSFKSRSNFFLQGKKETSIEWLEDKKCYRTVLFAQVGDHKSEVANPSFHSDEMARTVLAAAAKETESCKRFEGTTKEKVNVHAVNISNNTLQSSNRTDECYIDELIPITRSLSLHFLERHTEFDQDQLEGFKIRRCVSADSFFVGMFRPTLEVAENQAIVFESKQGFDLPVFDTASKSSLVVRTNFEKRRTSSSSTSQESSSTKPSRSEPDHSTQFTSNSGAETASAPEKESLDMKTDVNTPILSFFPAAEELPETTLRAQISTDSQSSILDTSDSDEEKVSTSLPVFFHHSEEERPLSANLSVEEKERVDKAPQPTKSFAIASTNATEEEEEEQILQEKYSSDTGNNVESQLNDTNVTKKSTESNSAKVSLQRMMTFSPETTAETARPSVIGEEVYKKYTETASRRRTAQFLRAASDAEIIRARAQSAIVRKVSEQSSHVHEKEEEDEDAADVLCSAIEDITPRILHRKTSAPKHEADGKKSKKTFMIKAITLAGICTLLLYAGWRLYQSS